MDYQSIISQETAKHRDALAVLEQSLFGDIEHLARLAIDTLDAGGKLLIFGNGGSASDAQHFAAELTGRFVTERRGLPAIALTTDSSALTAISNDYGFDRVFARQVEALAQPGDLCIGISTSGGSANVVRALQAARLCGCKTAGLAGRTGGVMPDLCDVTVTVSVQETARIQEIHILIIHILCHSIDIHFAAQEKE